MAVITENLLRSQFFKKKPNESILNIPKGTILTPSAKSYLNERKIKIEFVEQNDITEDNTQSATKEKQHQENNSSLKYRLIDGSSIDVKPEYMTSLASNLIVYKDHGQIIFRGKLDSLQAKVIEGQLALADNMKLVKDLSNVLDFVRNIFQSEVTSEPLEVFQLLGMSEKEILELSHQSKSYFGIDHFYLDYRMGKEIVVLNALRTAIRETEVSAYQAFKREDGSTYREDLILALNRLSALCWVMMFKCKTGYYSTEEMR